MRPLLLLALLTACAAPAPAPPASAGLRVCVQEERLVESWAKSFAKAAAVAPREGRDCDLTETASVMNAGKVTLRSAYDGSVLAEIEGPVELVPKLAALSLAPGTAPYKLLLSQREKSGFTR